MTHPIDMPESAGRFTEHELAHDPCRKCGGRVDIHLWESSCGGYEDEKHECTVCGHYFWIDGIDS